jgi:hypothetical protein
MQETLREGHRVRHVRDGLSGTVAGIHGSGGERGIVFTYMVKWDNGSFESRIRPDEIVTLATGNGG